MLKPVENSIKYEVKEKCLTLAMPQTPSDCDEIKRTNSRTN